MEPGCAIAALERSSFSARGPRDGYGTCRSPRGSPKARDRNSGGGRAPLRWRWCRLASVDAPSPCAHPPAAAAPCLASVDAPSSCTCPVCSFSWRWPLDTRAQPACWAQCCGGRGRAATPGSARVRVCGGGGRRAMRDVDESLSYESHPAHRSDNALWPCRVGVSRHVWICLL